MFLSRLSTLFRPNVKLASAPFKALTSAAPVVLTLLALCAGIAQAQSTASLQMVMGNPSGATSSTSNENNYLMQKAQYAMSYNRSHATPNWVSWHLGPKDIGTTGRSGSFAPDTTLPAGWTRITTSNYTGSGYDRGHNCPSGDRTVTETDNAVTFLMTNIVPQEADNNQGPWADLETYCRTLATAGNELFIISCGNTYGTKTISSGQVFVPGYMSKVIVVQPKGSALTAAAVTNDTRVICVDMPNIAGIRSDDWQNYIISVDQLEAYTGYDFLSAVSPAVQAFLEAKVDSAYIKPTTTTLSTGAASVVEGNTGTGTVESGTNFLQFPLTATVPLKSSVSVSYATSNTTATTAATAGIDYLAASGKPTLRAGFTSGTLSVPIIGDTVYEPNETLTMTLSGVTGTTLGTASATGTITNDDKIPTLAIADASAKGSAGSMNFVVTMSNASSTNVTASYATANNTALAGTNYTAQSGTLTFTPGQTTKTITVTGLSATATDKKFQLNLSNPSTGVTFTRAAATGTILAEASPTLSVSLSSASPKTNDTLTATATPTNFSGTPTYSYEWSVAGTVKQTGASSTFDLSVPGQGDKGNVVTCNVTATSGAQSALGSSSATVANSVPAIATTSLGNANQNSAYGPLQLNGTDADNDVLTWSAGTGLPAGLSLSNTGVLSGTPTVSGTFTFTSTVTDSQNASSSKAMNLTVDAPPTLSISNASTVEGNAGVGTLDSGTKYLSFTITLSRALSSDITVKFNTANGTALADSDYLAVVNGEATIAAGQTTSTLLVAVLGDTTNEPDETLTVTLSNVEGVTLGTANASGTIVNDDLVPSVSVGDSSAKGSAGSMSFSVELSNPSSNEISVSFATADGSAVSGTDYTAQNGSVTFSAGQTTKVVTISGLVTSPNDKSFNVNLSNASTGISVSKATATGTILAEAPAPTPATPSGVTVYKSGLVRNWGTGRFVQTLILQNDTGADIIGPLYLVLDNLNSNLSIYSPNPTGYTKATTPAGSPYITLPGLSRGTSQMLKIEFVNPTNGAVYFKPSVLMGPGTP